MEIIQIAATYSVTALSIFLISVFFTGLAIVFFPKIGFLDRPEKYSLKRDPIPYYGGLAIFAAFLVSVLLFVPLSWEVAGLLFASAIIVGLGFLDDREGLSPFLRLSVQFIAALVLVISGIGILSVNLPFVGVLDFSTIIIGGVMVLSAFFTILWVMTILNVMNFLDGVSGLNSGVTFVAGLTLFFLSIHPGIHENPQSQVAVASLALVVSMVALGFLIFDFPKPKILMGDTGSTFLGFILAALAIFSGGKVATAFIVLGVPILDMIWVVVRRIINGQPFWKGDLKHLHHRFLEIGFREDKVVWMYLGLSAVFGLFAILLVSSLQKFFVIIALLILMLILGALLVFMPKKK
ncbi:undecaprenyl/decaprenyl-phosphate alpha-N-acetylglucosaminyl 1-phosphate transferase [Patescibacteria group bacterium]|nr:undecaprenyl/decaprenyl-phosphate alpha-N-acetylglucosaminyl 1-phosphate transferase [Patescibacteria group bacterium]